MEMEMEWEWDCDWDDGQELAGKTCLAVELG